MQTSDSPLMYVNSMLFSLGLLYHSGLIIVQLSSALCFMCCNYHPTAVTKFFLTCI